MSTATVQFDTRNTRRPARRVTSPTTEAWGSVRLTRRGRLSVLLAVLAIAFLAFTLVGGPAVSTGATHHASAEQVVVEPGQTLWDIAKDVAPGEDPRTVIAEIVDLNALTDGGSIRAGQPLYVPEY